GRRICLTIAGGIAAYKSLELIRRLREQGAAVRCVMTEAARQFITPLSVASLSEDKVYGELWSLTDESEMGHIRLSREADLVVVAPATANLIARMAAGLADDLAATALLASDKPVMMAPAMNAQMWAHPGRYLSNPSSGKQGHAIAAALAGLGAETVLVSGPTQEPTPPGVRLVAVETASEMLAACEDALPVDVAVMAAAVSDWRVANAAAQKLKKNGE